MGSDRAARCIAAAENRRFDAEAALDAVRSDVEQAIGLATSALAGGSNLAALMVESMAAMSRAGAAVRNAVAIAVLLGEVRGRLNSFRESVRVDSPAEWPTLYRYRDMLISQSMVLSAMLDYLQRGGHSRGAALYTDAAGEKPLAALPESCRFVPDSGALSGMVQEVCFAGGDPQCLWRPVRPIPQDDDFFENVWRDFRAHGNVY